MNGIPSLEINDQHRINIFLSVILLIGGKMPLLGGKVIRGIKVRCTGVIIFFLSVSSYLLSTKLSVILNVLTLTAIGGAYFFLKGEAPTQSEAKTMLFTSAQDEKKTYLSFGFGDAPVFMCLRSGSV